MAALSSSRPFHHPLIWGTSDLLMPPQHIPLLTPYPTRTTVYIQRNAMLLEPISHVATQIDAGLEKDAHTQIVLTYSRTV